MLIMEEGAKLNVDNFKNQLYEVLLIQSYYESNFIFKAKYYYIQGSSS